MLQVVPKEKLKEFINQPLEPSDWFLIDQDRVNAFADATLDHQFIHLDEEQARQTPFGGTIAHGYLTLSMLPYLTKTCGVIPENVVMGINYGSDKVRFLQPVRVGSEIRAHVLLKDISEKSPGQWLARSEVTIEIKGMDKPALISESLAMFVVQ